LRLWHWQSDAPTFFFLLTARGPTIPFHDIYIDLYHNIFFKQALD
jgi:hypothetical protein